ncbi:hypothetical protein GCM10014719_69340 [Planomonospora parontospora subsp. antibiotica]|nr:hypothetical protein GCM10014719_69340 [Planomonospora parontospora subsp. antibiotica]GII19899.1 hypothetical protein Ppa05_66250 [Planomonospora parontospora subsp. antibiotica]
MASIAATPSITAAQAHQATDTGDLLDPAARTGGTGWSTVSPGRHDGRLHHRSPDPPGPS